MRFIIKCSWMAVIIFFPLLVFGNDLGRVRLSIAEGGVQVLVKDTTDWTDAAINLPMTEGDRIWVPAGGKAELQLQGGVYVREDENTALDLLTVNHESAQFYLDQGHIYINNRRGGIKTVQVDTPTASIRTYDNSVMMLDLSEDGVAQISVLKGYAYAESRAGATRVSAGNTLVIRGEENAELAPIASPDEWERWNTERDRYLTSWGESSRYLPDELHEYSSDFDQNGRWNYTGDYGYVWVPAEVSPGWTPYSYGSWVWIRGNYVWIDYSPWGWAPSHYGRWTFVASFGWCWVPPAIGAAYWGPGYVGWTVTPTYVAWVPLAPGEIYYGYGYYGPGSVNITTVNVNTVVVNRSYANARVNNSVVVVQRDTFGTGSRVPARTRENPFIDARREPNSGKVNIVPPRERPEHPIVLAPRENRDQTRQRVPERLRSETTPQPGRVAPSRERPGVKQERTERPAITTPAAPRTQERQLPPERVRRTDPETMKNERPLVRNRESSVFRQQQPNDLPVRRSKEPREIKRRPASPPQHNQQNRGERGERGEPREAPGQR